MSHNNSIRLLLLLLIASMVTAAHCPQGNPPPDDPGRPGSPPLTPLQPISPDAGSDPDADSDPLAIPCDPCAEGDIVFAAMTFERACGSPSWSRHSFTLETDGNSCVVVTNVGSSAAWVEIDGQSVFAPNDFNPQVTQLHRTSPLAAGDHELAVRVTSAPGSSITVEIRACAAAPDPDPDPDPGPPLCSAVATDWCEALGWQVVAAAFEGNIVCTVDGRPLSESCDGCGSYLIVAWEDGTGDRLCQAAYSTQAGNVYGGHQPCQCGDNLVPCGSWDMQGCQPD